ncbi:VOC family protein [Sphingobacterium siyangense]|uniref:VOC family protein n=1 Tax=Sphingobacterium siyangense TaxID=459529 RepID=UPI0019622B94|nr:VOC family protein [Sphingobacterium siyangense]QRY57433.1 VOC family protein [Sphingobacterium siyangense]
MKYKSLNPILYTKNLDHTIQFYTEKLEFTCIEKNEALNWALLQSGTIEIMFSHPVESIAFETAQFTGSLYFNIADVDNLWESLKDNVKICYEIETFEWGMREFAIYDNNGYVLQFGEKI